jgi:sodium/proline symporter
VWIGRLTVLALGAVAIPLAWSGKSVFEGVFDAWSVLGASLGPAVVLGLLSRRANRWGAVAGIATGLVISQGWSLVKPVFWGDKLFGNGLVPGFFLGLILAYVVSLLTSRSERA